MISETLKRHGVPPLMKVTVDDASGCMIPFQLEGLDMCRGSSARCEIQFAFVEGFEMQAGAIQDEIDVVVVYAGMYWMLCRIASTAAGSNVFPAFSGVEDTGWNPDVLRSIERPRHLLEERKPFDWVIETASWIDAPERQFLFLAILNVLFRFVVFHEIAHVTNDHGRRKGGETFMIDSPLRPRLLKPDEAIASQAREIIADSLAFKHTLEVTCRELALKADLELTEIYREKLLPDESAIVDFVLTIVFLYFRIADLSDWQSFPLDQLSHPPAPFRAKALAGALLEHRFLGISEEAARWAIRRASIGSSAIVSVMLGIYPDLHWLEKVGTKEHDLHFNRICEEIPNWHGRL